MVNSKDNHYNTSLLSKIFVAPRPSDVASSQNMGEKNSDIGDPSTDEFLPFVYKARLNFVQAQKGRRKLPDNVEARLSRLFHYVSRNNAPGTSSLIKSGIDINYQDYPSRNTALHYAAVHSSLDIVNALLRAPECNPTLINAARKSAAELAVQAGRPDGLIDKLVDAEIKFLLDPKP